MAYYSQDFLNKMNFLSLGKNVKISDKASFYNCEKICIGENSRIDDFCVLSGKIRIGRNVHITPQCLIAGGEKGIVLEDFTTIAYGCKIFTQSDDYSGQSMTNSTIPTAYKNEYKEKVVIKKYSIIGAGVIIFPGIILGVGTAVGAGSIVLNSTQSWSIYTGIPAKKLKDRSQALVLLAEKYLKSGKH